MLGPGLGIGYLQDLSTGSGWLDLTASWASIGSLAVTLAVLWKIRRIQRFVLFTARVPVLVEGLDQQASELSDLMNDYAGSLQPIAVLLGEVDVTLASLASKLDSAGHRELRVVRRAVKHYRQNEQARSADALREIYIEMRKIVAHTRHHMEDRRWEVPGV